MDLKMETCNSEKGKRSQNKRQKRYFTSSEKNMIINIYEHVKETWPCNEYPYKTKLNEKTATICGIGIASVYRILKEYSKTERVKSPILTKKRQTFSEKIDGKAKSGIRKKVHDYYMRGELPTFKKILDAVNADEELPNFKKSTFHKILGHLKFKNLKLKGANALIEKKDVILWRIDYLKALKVFRNEKRNIFYVNEVVLNTGNSDPKSRVAISTSSSGGLGTSGKNTSAKSRCLIALHIGSEKGFLEGAGDIIEAKDPQDSIDSDHFEHWFENILPKLGENSVVVLEDAPYSTRRSEKTPNQMWTRRDIQQWLRSKRISFQETNLKVELLKKVGDVKGEFQSYAVDVLAKKYKVGILRLPPHHCDLNPSELIWSDIRDHLDMNDPTFTTDQMKSLLQDSIKNVSAEKWQFCVNHVTQIEDYFYHILDVMIETTIDTFGTDVSDTESETESCSSSTDESLLKFME